MKLSQSSNLKTKLSTTLKSWFPILQSSTLELEEVLSDFVAYNPLVEIQSKIQIPLPPKPSRMLKGGISDRIESLSIYNESLYEVLESQILPPLFPTPLSQKIAFMIIDEINESGYFEGDTKEIALSCNVKES